MPFGRLPHPDRGVIKRCFARNPYRFDDTLDNSILDFIIHEEFDEGRIDELLNEFENPAKILDTNWYAIKPMYEKKYRELINDKEKFVSINDIRLSRDCVKKAIKYLREIYRHRIGKTKVISLNNHTEDGGVCGEPRPLPRQPAYTEKQLLAHSLSRKTVAMTHTSPSHVTFLHGNVPSGSCGYSATHLPGHNTHQIGASHSYDALSWIKIHGETTTAHRPGSRSTRSNARVADTRPGCPQPARQRLCHGYRRPLPRRPRSNPGRVDPQ
jgi:hypothetical protein